VGYKVGHGRFLWGVWLAVGRGGLRGVSWWVCGVAHGGGATHGLSWVALKCLCGCGSVFGEKEICVSYL
jgi:hypothetical protein